MDGNDWAAVAAWAAVAVSLWGARSAWRSQEEAKRHAEKLQKRSFTHDDRMRERDAKRQKAEKDRERHENSRKVFVRICAMPTTDSRGAHHNEAKDLTAELYATLGDDRLSRYIACTAMAFFAYGRDTADTRRAKELDEERRQVEGYLTAPGEFLHVPNSSAVRTWAKDAHSSAGWRGSPWLLRLDE